MKHKLFTTLLVMLMSMTAWGADGDTFKATTIEGVEMEFKILSENLKTCQVGVGEFSKLAIPYLTEGEVTIPNKVNEYDVVAIGQYSFAWCHISSIVIPEGVEIINEDAFSSCSNLTSFKIPSTVNSISGNIIGGCYNLKSIIVDGDNSYYDSRNNCNAIIETSTNKLIAGCKKTKICKDVEVIGTEAFKGSEINSILLPANIREIEYYAFSGIDYLVCASKTPITIDNNAFISCEDMIVYVPANCADEYEADAEWGVYDIKEGVLTATTIEGVDMLFWVTNEETKKCQAGLCDENNNT